MTRPMRLLMSAYACLPHAGTEPGNGWNWAKHLAERGMQVHVLTVEDGRERIEAVRAAEQHPRVSFSYVPVPRRFRHTSGMHYQWWQFAALREARRLHRAQPFDLAHHVTYGSIQVPTQLWRLGIPTIFGPVGGGQTAPEAMMPLLGATIAAERRRTRVTRMIERSPLHRYWMRRLRLVLTTNGETFAMARAMGVRHVAPWFDVAIPKEFCAEEPRKYAATDEPLRLIWMARFLPRRALPLALDAVRQANTPCTLTIVGHGLPQEKVHAMIAERGLTGRIFWEGKEQGRASVRAALCSHDAMLFTSIRESCGAQLVEAMAVGLPILTLDHHGPRDLVPDGAGLKVPVTTPERVAQDMARAIETFAAMSPEEKSAMSRVAWETGREMNYTDGACRFEMLYRCLLNGDDLHAVLPAGAAHIRTALSR